MCYGNRAVVVCFVPIHCLAPLLDQNVWSTGTSPSVVSNHLGRHESLLVMSSNDTIITKKNTNQFWPNVMYLNKLLSHKRFRVLMVVLFVLCKAISLMKSMDY